MTERTIFLTAIDKHDPAERARYLDDACAGDAVLRQRIEALLRSSDKAEGFLSTPAVAAASLDDATRTHHLQATPQPDGLASGASDHTQAEPVAWDESLAFLAPARVAGALGRLDHHDVLAVVGQGGMGMVLKARDTTLERIVAIKVLAPQLAASGNARKRFAREAKAAAAVRDEHVVDIHAVHDTGPIPYLVMEYIGGITLDDRIKQGGPLEVKEILRIGMQAAKGLAAAHAQGLIHRDIKPGNILLENGVQRVKITDFGLARAADDASLTQSGVIAGTPMYMSPEQARGDAVDHRSDLFSLGSVLYTLCTGHPAFRASSTMAVLKRVCEERPRPIREVNPDIPDWLAAIVVKLLAKAPAERFQNAAELADLLSQCLAHMQQPQQNSLPSLVLALPQAPRAGGAQLARWRRPRSCCSPSSAAASHTGRCGRATARYPSIPLARTGERSRSCSSSRARSTAASGRTSPVRYWPSPGAAIRTRRPRSWWRCWATPGSACRGLSRRTGWPRVPTANISRCPVATPW